MGDDCHRHRRKCKRHGRNCKCHRRKRCHKPKKCKPICNLETHDYVIIGSGAGGLTCGALLACDKEDVVVLEAGPDKDDDPNIKHLLIFGTTEPRFRDLYFWPEDTHPPRASSVTLPDQTYSGGRLLGGSTSINASLVTFGDFEDYAGWGGLFADQVYVKKVLDALETYHGTTQGTRGDAGPLQVVQSPAFPVAVKMLDALKFVLENTYNIAAPIVDDYNVTQGTALSYKTQEWLFPPAIDNLRCSVSIGMVKVPKLDIDIRLKAFVLKILFSGKKATGVEYLQDNQVKVMFATKKVILAAGPRSSCVLERSGIGDKALLDSVGIPVLVDNPQVGQNILDQNEVFYTISVNPDDNKDIAIGAPLSNPFQQLSGQGFFPAPIVNVDSGKKESWMTLYNLSPGRALMFLVDMRPKSRGIVHISTDDPIAPINPNLMTYSNPEDIARGVRLVELSILVMDRLNSIDPLYFIIADVSDPAKVVLDTFTNFHQWNGNCRIGDVVGSDLHVFGTKNLMIADLSVARPPISLGTEVPALLAGATAYKLITGKDPVFCNFC